jgi:uncharacterized protein
MPFISVPPHHLAGLHSVHPSWDRAFPPFHPPWWLAGAHRMTLIPRWWPRTPFMKIPPARPRIFRITSETGLLTQCQWQDAVSEKPTILLVHGLEGCTDSHYMRGLAQKIWRRGWNCIRINQRNCGGSEHLTPTLYHGGLSQDLRAIIQELTDVDRCRRIWLVGYSMGGNLTLKLGGEIGDSVTHTERLGCRLPEYSTGRLRSGAPTPRQSDLP